MFANLIDLKSYKKAQGMKVLCLSFIAVLTMLPAASFAQSNDFTNRLNRLENELQTLNRAFYKGETPVSGPTPLYQAPSAGTASQNAQTELRLQQIENDMRQLTGKIEQQRYDFNQLKLKIDQLQQAQEAASKKPEPVAQQPSVMENLYTPSEPSGMKILAPTGQTNEATASYEKAFASLKAQKYQEAEEGFGEFLKSHKDHVLAANAKYWMGETFYVRGQYKDSARAFAEGFQTYPDSAKAPDMLLKLGMSLSGLKKDSDACVALKQLPLKFPTAPAQVLERGAQEVKRLNCSS